ncbi:MAG TPA: T9SS type A sorting domain-containing protein, partial [Chitinophagales bacterium]|nr:T9SS type A sorting domain-containing protein [Chitinophagales bacterium]
TAKSGSTPTQTFTTTLRLASGSDAPEETMSMHPNPAGDQTMIQYSLPQASHVYIEMYDVSGKEIKTLLDDDVEEGGHSLLLSTNHFSKGVYFVKMISDFGIENQKLIVQ